MIKCAVNIKIEKKIYFKINFTWTKFLNDQNKKGRDLGTKFCACKVFIKLIRRKDGIKPSYQIVQNNEKILISKTNHN